ncbi:hypothetical protein EJB05_13781, partial [Eragrostis curvula]
MNQFLSRSFHHPRVLPLPSLSGLASRHCRCPHLLPLASGAPAPSSSRLLDALRFRSCPQPSGLAVRPPFLSSFLPTTLPPPLVVVPLADWSLAPSLEEVDGNREPDETPASGANFNCITGSTLTSKVSCTASSPTLFFLAPRLPEPGCRPAAARLQAAPPRPRPPPRAAPRPPRHAAPSAAARRPEVPAPSPARASASAALSAAACCPAAPAPSPAHASASAAPCRSGDPPSTPQPRPAGCCPASPPPHAGTAAPHIVLLD